MAVELMAVLDAEALYATGGPNALRLATRGAVKRLQREGRQEAILTEIAVPLVDLANALRARGSKAEANGVLEHAVHDGVQAAVLAEAIQRSTTNTVTSDGTPPAISVDARGALYVGAPPEATDLASTATLANYLRDRLIAF